MDNNTCQCKWATPTMWLNWPLWLDADSKPWTCFRDGRPRPMSNAEPCQKCGAWELRTDVNCQQPGGGR